MKTLGFRKTADEIASFVRRYGNEAPRRAVFCTYDFLPARFEAVILPELTRRARWFRTLVLADQAALQQPGVIEQRSAQARYELAPVRLAGPGVFHPKLVLLQAGTHVLVGVGSGNLTPGGLGGNLELMLFASNGDADGEALSGSSVQFIHELIRSVRVRMPLSARRFVDRMSSSLPKFEGGPLLHNLRRPLIEQLAQPRKEVTRAVVISPWHSSAVTLGVQPKVVTALTRVLGVSPTIYTEGIAGKAPALGVPVRIVSSRLAEERSDDEETDGPVRPATLHAKAYMSVGRRQTTLWFGSANCTAPALLESVAGRGNVELLVRSNLSPSQLVRVEADLDRMFEAPTGVLSRAPAVRIPAPRGHVLSGSVSAWQGGPRLKLALVSPRPTSATLPISASRNARDIVHIRIPAGLSEIEITRVDTMKLVGSDAPPKLWEHVGKSTVAFPLSVECCPISDDAEKLLDDALDELSGRMPAAFRSSHSTTTESLDDEEDEGTDGVDSELAELTESLHQGALDRIAVRVELLRRRLASHRGLSPEALKPYRSAVEQLKLSPRIRQILSSHLGPEGKP